MRIDFWGKERGLWGWGRVGECPSLETDVGCYIWPWPFPIMALPFLLSAMMPPASFPHMAASAIMIFFFPLGPETKESSEHRLNSLKLLSRMSLLH